MKRRSRKTRRNPGTKIPVVPLALVVGGAYLILRNRGTSIDGMGDLGSRYTDIRDRVTGAAGSVVRTVKRVAAPIATAAGQLKTLAQAVPQVMVASLPVAALNLPPVTPFTAAAMLASTVMSQKGGQEEEAPPVQETQYQDDKGNIITEAEYNKLLAEQEAAQKAADEAAKNPPPPIYKDANGNVISEADYNRLLAMLENQAAAQNAPAPQPTTSTATTTAGPTVVKKLPPMPPTTPGASTGVVPQPEVLYFDANGQKITGSQFSQQMNALPAGSNPEQVRTATGYAYKVPAVASTPQTIQTATPPAAVTYAPSGGSQPSDYELPPAYTPPTAQQSYAPQQAAAPAAAAPGKLNPLVAVGTLAAVPLIFMLSGGK